MRVIILTQYFPPETGAPQNRLWALACGLRDRGASVTVLTAMPNYPGMRVYPGYRGRLFMREVSEGIDIRRAWIFTSRSTSVMARLANYFSFVLSSLAAGPGLPKADYLVCESPPLFLGWSAWLISRLKGAAMIFNVSDLWPESAEKLGLVKNRTALNLAGRLERFLYRKATLVTGQTRGIVDHIAARMPGKSVYWLPNGADFRFYGEAPAGKGWRAEHGFGRDDLLFLYAGILGHAQGLEVIIRAAARLRDIPQVKFIIMGAGPEKNKLMSLAGQPGAGNIFFPDAVPKSELPRILGDIDAGIVPLRNLPLFLGAIPSKLFDFLAMRKPVLLGVNGEARDHFIEKGKAGLYFEPENDASLADRLREMIGDRDAMRRMGQHGFEYARTHFDRDKINDAFFQKLTEMHSSA